MDTIPIPPDAIQILLSDIWGTDSNNVWAVGHSDDIDYQIWHWDGLNWKWDYVERPHFSGHRYSPWQIFGFSEKDFIIVGSEVIHDRSSIIRYLDGNWILYDEIDAPICRSIWAYNQNNVFVGCDSGIVLKYNGNNWVKGKTNTNAQILNLWGFNENSVFAQGIESDQSPFDSSFYYLFIYDNYSWTTIDSFIATAYAPPRTFGTILWGSDINNFYSGGYEGLYKYNGISWDLIINNVFIRSVFGTASNHVFAGGYNQVLYHYNGNAWHFYNELKVPDTWTKFFNGIWCDDNSVFIISREGFQSFIYRGTLK